MSGGRTGCTGCWPSPLSPRPGTTPSTDSAGKNRPRAICRRLLGPRAARTGQPGRHPSKVQPQNPGVRAMTESVSVSERPLRLLFCCIENQCRSQMAEAFARLHGGGQVEPYSAGTRPSGRVHPKAIAAMRERGYDLTGHWSKGQTPPSKIDDSRDVYKLTKS